LRRRQARPLHVSQEIGPTRVTGSLGLLVRAVSARLLAPDVALAAYEQMRVRGGFLPELTAEDLRQAVDLLGTC